MDITGAAVGQIAKITAVDASGVPTAWGPADMPSGGGGGSSDAVLYTAQTLTDAQKKQARENVGAANEPYIIYAVRADDHFVNLDVSFNEISAAIQANRLVILAVHEASNHDYVQYALVHEVTPTKIIFYWVDGIDTRGGNIVCQQATITNENKTGMSYLPVLSLNDDDAFPQKTMASAPTKDMEIATKKYVDDHAGGGGGGGIFIIKAAMNGNSATLDKLYDEINEAVVGGKIAIMQVLMDGELAYQLQLSEIPLDAFTFTGVNTSENGIRSMAISVNSENQCNVERVEVTR